MLPSGGGAHGGGGGYFPRGGRGGRPILRKSSSRSSDSSEGGLEHDDGESRLSRQLAAPFSSSSSSSSANAAASSTLLSAPLSYRGGRGRGGYMRGGGRPPAAAAARAGGRSRPGPARARERKLATAPFHLSTEFLCVGGASAARPTAILTAALSGEAVPPAAALDATVQVAGEEELVSDFRTPERVLPLGFVTRFPLGPMPRWANGDVAGALPFDLAFQAGAGAGAVAGARGAEGKG